MKRILVAVVVAMVVTGCAAKDDSAVSTNGGYSISVKEVTLSDGTRCAVAVGAYKGGIDCDWDGPKE
jgi:hypothetical protein